MKIAKQILKDAQNRFLVRGWDTRPAVAVYISEVDDDLVELTGDCPFFTFHMIVSGETYSVEIVPKSRILNGVFNIDEMASYMGDLAEESFLLKTACEAAGFSEE